MTRRKHINCDIRTSPHRCTPPPCCPLADCRVLAARRRDVDSPRLGNGGRKESTGTVQVVTALPHCVSCFFIRTWQSPVSASLSRQRHNTHLTAHRARGHVVASARGSRRRPTAAGRARARPMTRFDATSKCLPVWMDLRKSSMPRLCSSIERVHTRARSTFRGEHFL